MYILYLTHDLSDPTTAKRVRMLRAGGAEVSVIGFGREKRMAPIDGCPTFMIGRSHTTGVLRQLLFLALGLLRIRRHRALFTQADFILARSLETLPLAVYGCSLSAGKKPIVYEVLDIHPLLLRTDWLGGTARHFEELLCRSVAMLLTSSPAFVREYYEKCTNIRVPYRLLENKVFGKLPASHATMRPTPPPWSIGWFGVIRCRRSFELLRSLVTHAPGRARVVIRGRVAYDQIPDFDEVIAQTPGMTFLGPYESPVDLEKIYGEVHFAWAIDWFGEGKNSSWRLPNRIYESGLYGVVPLALEGEESSRYLKNIGIGIHLPADIPGGTLAQTLSELNAITYGQMAEKVLRIPHHQWVMSTEECCELIADFKTLSPHYQQAFYHDFVPEDAPLLVVVPCYNEAQDVKQLLDYLLAEANVTRMRIVVVDGGSRDNTVAAVEALAKSHPELHVLYNPQRTQSTAINLAVRRFGHAHRYLVRMDVRAHYPAGYIRTLLDEVRMTGADSVVVSVTSVTKQRFRRAVAAVQHSPDATHPSHANIGRYVEHGRHALMRMSAFQSVGGYDEGLSRKEEVELDERFTRAGYKLWLTVKTTFDDYPRSSVRSICQKYLAYGTDRARALLRQGSIQRLRRHSVAFWQRLIAYVRKQRSPGR